eukprot:12687463-Alexandrium_andersonii.AAC.1
MTCAMCVAKANHIEEWEALRLMKRRNRCLTDKMINRVMQFQIAQAQATDMTIKDMATKNG